MGKKATLEGFGAYSRAVLNLTNMVDADVRPADEAAKRIQAIADGQPDPSVSSEFESILASAGYTPVELQVAQFRQWNQQVWGGFFFPEQIHQAMVSAPLMRSDQPLVYANLCWAMNHLAQTVDSVRPVLKFVYGEDKLYLSPSLTGAACSLPEGAPEFVPNHLWWEVVDFGANRDKAPDQVPAATAAGLSVLAAACHHKGAVKRHNGGDTPYWDVSGLRVKVPGHSVPYAPCVNGHSGGSVLVYVDPAANAYSGYAVPVIVR